MWSPLAGRVLVLLGAALLGGCTGGDGGKSDTGDTGGDETGGGGGNTWHPSGAGYAWFEDGTADNSVFHLELGRVSAPAEGEAYFGFLSVGGANPVALGEIPVSGEDLVFEHDIGVDGLISGLDTFVAYAGESDTAEEVWYGRVEPAVYDIVQDLVIGSTATDDGQGTLRAMESDLESLGEYTQQVIDGNDPVEKLQSEAEGISNAITGSHEDLDGDGRVIEIEGQTPILGASGYIALVKGGLDAVSAAVDVGDPVKDFANIAYDCTQRVESHAEFAATSAGIATACGATSSCDDTLADVVSELGVAQYGQDLSGDGSIDEETEGTVECALRLVAEMARMEVATR